MVCWIKNYYVSKKEYTYKVFIYRKYIEIKAMHFSIINIIMINGSN